MGEKLKTIIYVILAILTLGGAIWKANAHLNSEYAKNEKVELIAFRLDQKIAYDRRDELQKRLWILADKHRTEDCMQIPQPDRDRCRALKKEMAEIDKKFETK
jgi:hypothetical protein